MVGAILLAGLVSGAVELPRVVVYELRNDGADATIVRVIRDSLTTELAKDSRVEVVSADELKRVEGFEGDRQAVGCEASVECQAEIVQALGARYLVTGNVGKLGALTVINLSLTDLSSAKTLSRTQFTTRTIEDAPSSLRSAAPTLLAPIAGESSPPTFLIAGVSVAAIGLATTVVSGAIAIVANEDVPLGSGKDPQQRADAESLRNGAFVVSAIGGVAVVVGGVFIALGSFE